MSYLKYSYPGNKYIFLTLHQGYKALCLHNYPLCCTGPGCISRCGWQRSICMYLGEKSGEEKMGHDALETVYSGSYRITS